MSVLIQNLPSHGSGHWHLLLMDKILHALFSAHPGTHSQLLRVCKADANTGRFLSPLLLASDYGWYPWILQRS